MATTAEKCTGSDGKLWNCPYMDESGSVDIVGEIENILSEASSYLGSLLGAGTDSEVSEAIDELQFDICGADGECTSQELASYLQDLDI